MAYEVESIFIDKGCVFSRLRVFYWPGIQNQ